MSTLAELPELVGFFSYSRRDDERAGGGLSALRKRILDELGLQLGRDLRLWQDTAAIPHGSLWQDEIDRAVAESVFFIPIVTPSAIGSEHCKYEFDAFLARETALSRRNLVFPILYINVPGIETVEGRQQSEVLQIIHARQYFNWTTMRHRDLASAEAAEKIEQFCANICGALRQPWMSPDERRRQEELEAQRRRAHELELQVAQAEAARQQELREAADAEAKRRREQDEKLAAERRKAEIAEAEEANRRKAQLRAIEAEARRRQEDQDRLAAERVQRERAVPPENQERPFPSTQPNPQTRKSTPTLEAAPRFTRANLRRMLQGAALPLLLLVLWQIVSATADPVLFPTPTAILSSLFGGEWNTIVTDTAATLVRFVVAALLGAVAWFGFDRLFALSDRAGAMLRPLFWLLCSIPALAMIPLLLDEFGPRIAAPMAGLIATFLALTMESALGFGPARKLDKSSVVPRPSFAAAATAGFSAVLATEMYYADNGLGRAAALFNQLYDIPEILSVILVAAILGAIIRVLAGLLEGLTARRAAAVPANATIGEAGGPGTGAGNFAWSVVRAGLLPILIIFVWQLASIAGMVSISTLPSPTEIAAEWFRLLANGQLLGNAASTVWQMLAAILLSLMLGLPIARAIHSRAGAWLSPLFLILGAVPPVMWILLGLPWFGIGSASHIFAATVGASMAMLVRLMPKQGTGGETIEPGLRSRDLQAGVHQTVRMVFGLQIAGELIASFNGLGRLISGAGANADLETLFACLLTIAMIGMIADVIVDLVFRLVAAKRP